MNLKCNRCRRIVNKNETDVTYFEQHTTKDEAIIFELYLPPKEYTTSGEYDKRLLIFNDLGIGSCISYSIK